MNRFIALLVFSQFACTSVWFAANAVLPTLITAGLLPENALPYLTGAVQLGFILGTFTFALLNVADRFSPRYVFLTAALVAAGSTAALLLPNMQYGGMLSLRLLTGFALAGIYPVGMKIAADHHPEGLGKALGFLVGALVLGTAFPHFSQAFLGQTDWRLVILSTSVLALLGGLTLGLGTQDGPHRKAGQKIAPWAFLHVFRAPKFRSAAFGYFGHMWELYTFWAFVPFLLSAYSAQHALDPLPLSLLAFSCIAIGMGGCIVFGLISIKKRARSTCRLGPKPLLTLLPEQPIFLPSTE
ncbi:major facilitator superfamily mfs_1 [Nitritalea halalkaliphila LW7]|uniref:Major facilitator superfamily mfs_1 n=1 Tax=Nitritalea halalkaliphila LW7 TaxID=1189621 RepID=I5BU58_9BACT|nr:MFS transporter [Nitritalea halalkaliphila]EIM73110.1 major facilitator superfamily mfs_1 [Nitritalea halalkaliphila LW7]